VHRDTISFGILGPGEEVPVVDKIAHDEPSVRRLAGRLGDPRRLRACYEAGPTGFELARLHRAGELVAVRILTPTEVAVRDLCRTPG
jgi:transposase